MTNEISVTQLTVLRVGLRLAAVLGPAGALAQAISWAYEGRIDWPAHLDRSQSFDGRFPALSSDAHISWAGDVTIYLDEASVGTWIAVLLPSTLLALTITLVALLLLKVTDGTSAGEPFGDANVRRLRSVANGVMLAAVLVPLARSLADTVVVHAALPDSGFTFFLPFTPIVLGLLGALVVRTMAEAFRIGTELRRDTDGLV